jgi:hypothetical protein
MEKSSHSQQAAAEIQSIPAGKTDADIDKAYEFAKQHRIGPLSDEDNKRILRKIDRYLLPLLRTMKSAVRGQGSLEMVMRTDDHRLHSQLHGQDCSVLLGQLWPYR